MKVIGIEEIDGTQIAAEEIRSDLDLVLIPKNTVLKTSYVSALKNLGIHKLLVLEDEKENYAAEEQVKFIPKEVISYYVEALEATIGKSFREADFIKIEVLAERIVEYIRENANLKVDVSEERTTSIFEHSIMVTILSILIAIKLELPRARMYQIAIACLLHDMALLEIEFPLVDLHVDLLDEEKLEQYHNHPVVIREKIDRIPWITDDAKEIVLSHHERINGEGFPNKRKRQSIGCRIVQVADAYDRRIVGLEDQKFDCKELDVFMDSHKCNRFDMVVVDFLYQVIAK